MTMVVSVRLRCDDGSSRRERQRNVGREFHSFVIGRNAKSIRIGVKSIEDFNWIAVGRVLDVAFN